MAKKSEVIDSTLIRVGDLAKATGKTVRAIHLYEELGLLQPTTRSAGGFRLYERRAAERVRWIDLLHSLGFSLQEMREVLLKWWNAERGTEAMADLQVLFKRKLGETREAIIRHQHLERELIEGLDYLVTCRDCDQPGGTEVCIHCSRDHGVVSPPALIEGLQHAELGSHPARAPFVRVEDLPH